MKRKHELNIEKTSRSQSSDTIRKNPTILAKVIKILASSYQIHQGDDFDSKAFSLEAKIEYNNVIEYKHVLEEYKVYQGKLNAVYSEIESQGANDKEFFLENIKKYYLLAKGEILKKNHTIDDIRNSADLLIYKVKTSLWGLWEQSENIDPNMSFEVVDTCLDILIVDAFMRCNILEKPENDN